MSQWRSCAEAAREWWLGMQPSRADGRTNPGADRAGLSQLRRAAGVADMLGHGAVLDLYRRCGFRRQHAECYLPWVAAVALVLAYVRKSEPGARQFAAAVGRRKFEDEASAPMSGLRFRRLLAAREPDDVVRQLRRALALQRRAAEKAVAGDDGSRRGIDVGQLAADILAWPDPDAGARVRTRWAFDYHAAGVAAPIPATDAADPAPEPS